MNRHFLRCTYCERPMSVNVADQAELQFILEQKCPLCGELALRYMGRVQNTNLVKTGVKSACDLRCTNAIGPKCDCVCSNENHGTHRLVTFDRVVGKLEVVEKDLLNNNESYLARIKRMAEAKNRIKVKVVTFLNYRYREAIAGVKLRENRYNYELWGKYDKYKTILKKLDKIEDLVSIQRKVNTLAKMIPQIGSTLEYLEALSLEAEKVVEKVA
ncbi:MAG: hypothetical protein ACREBR_05515 [bacterium]